MKLFLPTILLIGMLVGCSQEPGVAAPEGAVTTEPTLDGSTGADSRAEVYYHIFIRSFADSNGDRDGDLEGIRQKLDYLQALGVSGILLTPLYPSAFYHNYFADDFYGIDEEFGSMENYVALVEDIHARGMTIIIDQEIQYVSGQHQWFQSASGNPQSSFDRFVLFKDDQNKTPIGTLFDLTEFDVWPRQKQSIFTVDMLSDETRSYFTEYLLYWMDPNGDGNFSDGADGFRIDHMMDDLDNAGILTGLFKEFWVPIFDELRRVKPDITIVAEQADWGYGERFLKEGEADMVFGFPIREAILDLDAAGFAEAVEKTNTVLGQDHDQFIFIENHDTDRAASHLEDPRALRLAAAANLLTGWTPIIYYGQELGMRGEKLEGDLPDALMASQHDVRDIPVREAMRWDSSRPGASADWYLRDPEAYDLRSAHQPGGPEWVDQQLADESSLLRLYQALMGQRKRYPALANGSTEVAFHDTAIVVLRRDHPDGAMLLAYNFSSTDAPLSGETEGWESVVGRLHQGADALMLSAYGVAIAPDHDAAD